MVTSQTSRRPTGTAVNHRAVLGVTSLALATVVAAVTSLNVALPSLARDTHAGQTQITWVVDAYALVFASLLLLGGAVGDRFGRRRALIAGLVTFGLGSLAAAFSSTPEVLITLRGVLGAGAALVMPATLSTVTSTVPAEAKAKAISVWAGVAGASAIVGLLVSGTVLEWWSWRSVFVLNVVLATVAVVAVARVVPESADPSAPRLDVIGALITVVGLGTLVYSIIEAPDTGWTSPRTLAGLGAGVLVLVGFVVWELHIPDPMLDPRLFRNREFAAGAVSITLQFFGFFGFVFLLLQYLQLVQGHRPLVSALCLIPMAIAMMPSARASAHLIDRVGATRVCLLGLAVLTGGFVVLAQLDAGSSYWLLLAGLLPLGAGMGLAMTPATAALTDALPTEKQGIGSAMNDLARELGGALGIAVLGSVLATQLDGRLPFQAGTAFATGMHNALLIAAAAGALALVVVALVRRRGQR